MVSDGNFREYLKKFFNNINWEQKLENLWDLSHKIIPFHTITRSIVRCWNVRVTHRPTFEELKEELMKYYGANQESTNTTTKTTTPLNYQTHTQAIFTSRLLNCSSLPKPKNAENFKKELEELTQSMPNSCPSKDSGTIDLAMSNF
ncbi:hypothetical protein Glove_117g34 [Diversispora epigaea]|uniref:Serine-threonine/tyrosine-protein kinase catalytic domain-containing protein n=1 Tax=Diversispora epigaea TaxID=1348612 RepID=A0A397J911_9GLOM|nr:hypothetical protein Glove_117g34 [Diversispora epigaea]